MRLTIAAYNLSLGEVMGEQAPGTACSEQVEDSIDYFSDIPATTTPTGLGGWDEGSKQGPLAICEVSVVR